MTSTEANRIIKMSKQLDTISIKFDAAKVKPYLNKQLPEGWDDEDNAEFECEFFEFLRDGGILDDFIDRNIQYHGKFKLARLAEHFISQAFIMSSIWHSYSDSWIDQLHELNQNLTQTK